MEVNGSGGRLDRKTSKEKSVKKKSTKEKGKQPEAWNRANHRVESMVLYVRQDVSGRTYKIILSGLLPWVTACSIHGAGGLARLSASGSNGQRKRKTVRNP